MQTRKQFPAASDLLGAMPRKAYLRMQTSPWWSIPAALSGDARQPCEIEKPPVCGAYVRWETDRERRSA